MAGSDDSAEELGADLNAQRDFNYAEDSDDLFDDEPEPEAFPGDEFGHDLDDDDDCLFTGLDWDDEDPSLCDIGDDATADDEEWSTDLHGYKPADFSGPPPGPTRPLDALAKELDFFYLMFPQSLIEHLAKETNQFAEQKQDGNPDAPRWKPVSLDEMKVFLGVRISMTVIVVPDTRIYWKVMPIFGPFYIASVMKAKRFQQISENFCANDQMKECPKGDPKYDKLYVVRPVFDEVLARCLQEYNPHPSCLIHASEIAYPGELRSRCMPKKPYDMKVLMRADPVSRYCCEFQVYSGEVTSQDQEKEPELRFPPRMVLELCQKLKGLNYVVNMDSYFTSPVLFKKLHSLDILARGTVCRKLKGFPHALLSQTLVPKTAKQGNCAFAQQGSMSACAYSWQNKRVIRLVSTADDPTIKSTMDCKEKGKKKKVPYPSVMQEYNDCMPRMNKSDNSRTAFPTARPSKKWWVYFFWCLVDVAVSNAFILMKESPAHQRFTSSGKRKRRTIDDFREKLCMQLMAHR